MNNLKLSKCCFIAVAIALLAVFVAAPAGAGGLDRWLYGDYTYNVAATCVNAACGQSSPTGPYDCVNYPGFNPDTLALRVPGSQKSYGYNVQGVIHFDGHGKFTLKGEILTIRSSLGTNPTTDIPVSQLDLDADGTYVVDSVGNGLIVDITFSPYTTTIKSGPYQGFVYNFSSAITLRGRLDTVTGSSTLIISTTIPDIEEQVLIAPSDYVGKVPNEQRICNLTGSLVKLSPWHWFSK
jgi:hypothetical protein